MLLPLMNRSSIVVFRNIETQTDERAIEPISKFVFFFVAFYCIFVAFALIHSRFALIQLIIFACFGLSWNEEEK